MSKTSQRKRSHEEMKKEMYQQGFDDATNFFGFRWISHPHMKQYKRGFNDANKKPR